MWWCSRLLLRSPPSATAMMDMFRHLWADVMVEISSNLARTLVPLDPEHATANVYPFLYESLLAQSSVFFFLSV